MDDFAKRITYLSKVTPKSESDVADLMRMRMLARLIVDIYAKKNGLNTLDRKTARGYDAFTYESDKAGPVDE